MEHRVGVPYLVVWRGYDKTLQSEVLLLDNQNPEALTNNDWVALAALSEGDSVEEVQQLLQDGYDLYLVCDYPNKFYV